MALLFLEALGAALLFIAIIWWTMFAGRHGGEPLAPSDDEAPEDAHPQALPVDLHAPAESQPAPHRDRPS